MISYPAFFDELEKISEDQRKNIDRETLKRHLKVVGTVGLGAGLGYGTGALVRKYLQSHEGMEKIKKLPPGVLKWAPAVAGGGAGLLYALNKMKQKKIQDYTERGDEGKRPK